MEIGSANLKRATAVVLACIGWSALVLQFVLHLQVTDSMGLTLAEALIRFFSYFTIQVNIFAALMLTAFAIDPKSDDRRNHAFTASGVAVYIATVGLGYGALLRHLRPPSGAPWTADFLLHDFMPAAYVLFWLAFIRKAELRRSDPLLWLVYPLVYLAFVFVRGGMSGFYPYPFIHVGNLGYASVAVNTVGLLIFCAALGTVFVAVGRWFARRQTR